MLVPKKNRLAVYTYLFQQGVIVCEKNMTLRKHPHIEVPNLHVAKLLQSLKSRAYVTENFSWQWYYYSLTNEGIEYLREYLHIDEKVFPATLKKSRPQPPPSFGRQDRGGRFDRPDRRGRDGDRDGYRGPKKMDGAPSDFGASRGAFRGRRGGRGGGGFRGRD